MRRSVNGWCLSDHWQFSSLSSDNLLSPPPVALIIFPQFGANGARDWVLCTLLHFALRTNNRDWVVFTALSTLLHSVLLNKKQKSAQYDALCTNSILLHELVQCILWSSFSWTQKTWELLMVNVNFPMVFECVVETSHPFCWRVLWCPPSSAKSL